MNEMETEDKGILRPNSSPSERWAGKLGDEYTIRNDTQDYTKRTSFWKNIEDKYNPKKVLEVGCNKGIQNILWFDKARGYGIDVNEEALMYNLYDIPLWRCYGSATDIPFKDNFFDLVFTCGVLIHIPPKEIEKAMKEIIRTSNKYVLAIEYCSEQEKERPFLGEMGITWERPYNYMYIKMGLEIVEAGFLTETDGFNDLSYYMFRKGK